MVRKQLRWNGAIITGSDARTAAGKSKTNSEGDRKIGKNKGQALFCAGVQEVVGSGRKRRPFWPALGQTGTRKLLLSSYLGREIGSSTRRNRNGDTKLSITLCTRRGCGLPWASSQRIHQKPNPGSRSLCNSIFKNGGERRSSTQRPIHVPPSPFWRLGWLGEDRGQARLMWLSADNPASVCAVLETWRVSNFPFSRHWSLG